MQTEQAKTEEAETPTIIETKHVHAIYNTIATHFASTRYKPWPIVEQFLNNLPVGSCGLDVGCGNGKYLSVNQGVFIVASDRSDKLVNIARSGGQFEGMVADGIDLPHPLARFDFAICIAVVHHFSTPERRIAAIRATLNTLRLEGKALFFVWALEQVHSRREWTSESEQDVLVPWVTKPGQYVAREATGTFFRYYHLYREGELQRDIIAAGGRPIENGYDRDNWWVVACRSDT